MSELSHFELSKCVICQLDTQELLLQMTDKGTAAVIHSCVAREMHKLEVHLKEHAGPFVVHGNCRKLFTDLRNVQSACSNDDVPVKRLRSSVDLFDWKHMCFFCKLPADFESDKSAVRQVQTLELREAILTQCSVRGDEWALDVQGRLEDCVDLVHPEAVYHCYCHTRFFQGRDLSKTGACGRPEDTVNADAFDNLCDCEWLESSCEDRLYTLDDLQQHMSNYVFDKFGRLPDSVYSTRYLKKKLQMKYGENVYFAEVSGRKNVMCFRNLCSFIINDKWYDDRNHDPEQESKRIVTMAAKLIVSEIRSMPCDLETYPTISDMRASDTTPPLLHLLLRNMISSQMKQFTIAQCILQAARPRTFIAPLLLGLGVQLDHNYGSKFLLQQLSRLGMTASYDEVERYRQSVLEATCPDSVVGSTFPSCMTQ